MCLTYRSEAIPTVADWIFPAADIHPPPSWESICQPRTCWTSRRAGWWSRDWTRCVSRVRERGESEESHLTNSFFCLGVEQALVCSERLRTNVLQRSLCGRQGHHGWRYRPQHCHRGHASSSREKLRISNYREYYNYIITR